ncbi:hypothetical protein BGZ65_006110 [Modicella reniformis]|uniref:Uncharacterized protein n=1 Tax=Modicella reniformis TaxID=1440133 RepID=A0A9P6M8J0_9FUNG|nr:hypothetical protein BGZ65_006110 [Modicella reniformis]
MHGSTSVLDIPLLLDMICTRLESMDIGNCALCSKAWLSAFGPYRFKSVLLTKLSPARISFLNENSNHIRELTISLTRFETFDSSHCYRLRKLSLSFTYEDEEESDDEFESLDQEELDVLYGAYPPEKPNKPECAAKLIQRNQGLRAFHIVPGDNRRFRPFAKPILNAIASHTFLKTIHISMCHSCLMFIKILRNFPSRKTPLGLRRLALNAYLYCFSKRMFIPLLEQCPELEELAFPNMACSSVGQDDYNTKMAQVLSSRCKRLHTLNQDSGGYSISSDLMDAVLKEFSRGFRQLRLYNVSWSYSGTPVLNAFVTSATVNTIEVLTYHSEYNQRSTILAILKQCPRLRECRVNFGNRELGIEISEFSASMDEGWKCWDTLEVLEMKVYNRWGVLREKSTAKARRCKTVRDVRDLCLRLRTFPKLTTLNMTWLLMTARGSLKMRYDMFITLVELNEDAMKKGTTLLTKDDMVWTGLL